MCWDILISGERWRNFAKCMCLLRIYASFNFNQMPISSSSIHIVDFEQSLTFKLHQVHYNELEQAVLEGISSFQFWDSLFFSSFDFFIAFFSLVSGLDQQWIASPYVLDTYARIPPKILSLQRDLLLTETRPSRLTLSPCQRNCHHKLKTKERWLSLYIRRIPPFFPVQQNNDTRTSGMKHGKFLAI